MSLIQENVANWPPGGVEIHNPPSLEAVRENIEEEIVRFTPLWRDYKREKDRALGLDRTLNDKFDQVNGYMDSLLEHVYKVNVYLDIAIELPLNVNAE